MSQCERSPTPCCVKIHFGTAERLNSNADFDVAQLADEVMAFGSLCPAEEHIARRLHQTITIDDALTVILESARTGVGFQHRLARFLNLEEQGITLTCHIEKHPTLGADA